MTDMQLKQVENIIRLASNPEQPVGVITRATFLIGGMSIKLMENNRAEISSSENLKQGKITKKYIFDLPLLKEGKNDMEKMENAEARENNITNILKILKERL